MNPKGFASPGIAPAQAFRSGWILAWNRQAARAGAKAPRPPPALANAPFAGVCSAADQVDVRGFKLAVAMADSVSRHPSVAAFRGGR